MSEQRQLRCFRFRTFFHFFLFETVSGIIFLIVVVVLVGDNKAEKKFAETKTSNIFFVIKVDLCASSTRFCFSLSPMEDSLQ